MTAVADLPDATDPEADAAWWAEILASEPTGPETNGRKPGATEPSVEGLADLYQPVDWHELWNTTTSEPDWLIPDVLERGRLHAIYAPRKHKKSLLALLMVGELIACRPTVLGHPNQHTEPLRVLYIDIENAKDDIRQRLQSAGYGPGDLANLTYLSFPSLPGLDTASGGIHLLALVERYTPDLMVLDTTSRVVTGKENDADTFRALYRHTLAPIKATGTAVLRLDHAGKNLEMGQRGSSAKGDDLDTAWVISMPAADRLSLRLDFQRTNHHPQEIELMMRGGPLRFERCEPVVPGPVPEIGDVAAVVAHLDRLGVARSAGRPTAARALMEAKLKFSNNVIAAALKIRKSCPQDRRTVSKPESELEINKSCPQDQDSSEIAAGQTCTGQLQDSKDSFAAPVGDELSGTGGLPRRGTPGQDRSLPGQPGTPQNPPLQDQPVCRGCGSSDDRIRSGFTLCGECRLDTWPGIPLAGQDTP